VFTVYFKQFTVHRLPFTVYRSPFAVRRLEFAVRGGSRSPVICLLSSIFFCFSFLSGAGRGKMLAEVFS